MVRDIERLVRVEEPESLTLAGRMIGTLTLDEVEAYVEIRACGDTLTGIYAECGGLVIDGPYIQVLEMLGRPIRSRVSDTVRALTVRLLETTIGAERMERAAAARRAYCVRGELTDTWHPHLSDALAATGGLYDASLECSKGCTLDARQTRLLWAGWQALGAGEDFDLEAGIREARMEYHLVCRIIPVLDELNAFIEGVY